MNGYQLQKQMQALAEKYGYEPRPVAVKLSAPTPGPVTLSGVASTAHIDHTRVSFASRAFGSLAGQKPRLCYDHDVEAGHIDRLSYGPDGELLIIATATHETARRCGAFSVAGVVRRYELRDTDTARFHAVVHEAELAEVSLVEAPCNSFCVVKSRWPALPISAPEAKLYALVIKKVEVLMRYTEALKEIQTCRT